MKMNEQLRNLTNQPLWTASSTKVGFPLCNIFDQNENTFWQSDGFVPHYIQAQFQELTFISRLSLFLKIDTDETYTPSTIVISEGNDPSYLTEIKKIRLSVYRGWNEIDLNISTIFLRIAITENNQTGRDSRIRQLKLWGSHFTPCVDQNIFFVSPSAFQYLSIR